jgi:hypothetical protein
VIAQQRRYAPEEKNVFTAGETPCGAHISARPIGFDEQFTLCFFVVLISGHM